MGKKLMIFKDNFFTHTHKTYINDTILTNAYNTVLKPET